MVSTFVFFLKITGLVPIGKYFYKIYLNQNQNLQCIVKRLGLC